MVADISIATITITTTTITTITTTTVDANLLFCDIFSLSTPFWCLVFFFHFFSPLVATQFTNPPPPLDFYQAISKDNKSGPS